MKLENTIRAAFAVGFAFALAGPGTPRSAHAQNVSETARAGLYSVNLKVLPAESFSGPHEAMSWDGGAKPDKLGGANGPNHHLVVFVKKSGKPVNSGTVTISYRRLPSKTAKWTTLPVAQMHVAGKSLLTTHFGNNVRLAAGTYQARVTVDGKGPATFKFTLKPTK